jgi:hypothetical protein
VCGRVETDRVVELDFDADSQPTGIDFGPLDDPSQGWREGVRGMWSGDLNGDERLDWILTLEIGAGSAGDPAVAVFVGCADPGLYLQVMETDYAWDLRPLESRTKVGDEYWRDIEIETIERREHPDETGNMARTSTRTLVFDGQLYR